jgi:hypothetical protein
MNKNSSLLRTIVNYERKKFSALDTNVLKKISRKIRKY